MNSIRTKITILNTIAVAAALLTATAIGVISIATFGHDSSEESLRLLCQDGKNSLNDYFDTVEQSAEIVSGLVSKDLQTTDLTNLADHVNKAKLYFKESIEHTKGVATYYYRFDPEISDNEINNELGFWYVDEGKGLEEHTPSSIRESECPWFNTPKTDGKASWLLPYDTDGLDSYWVVSYNVPIYKEANFVGVIGIEIGYQTLGEQISDIKALDTGYAFIVNNEDGTIIYHPYIDLLSMPDEEKPKTPEAFVKKLKGEPDKYGGFHIEYSFTDYINNKDKTVEKHCYVLGLTDEDMSIVVCVPISEVNNVWLSVALQLLIVALVVIAASIVVAILFSRRITKPLKELTVAAEEINKGNYDVKLDYKADDEIGVLTTTVNGLIEHLGGYINDLNRLAYADTLTQVNNKSAFDVRLKQIQDQLENPETKLEFAIGIFDCDDLKQINDKYGHDKGNIYLRNSCHLICRVFENSEVYRLGGDEFAVILFDKDYKNREKLCKYFLSKSAEICAFAKEGWEEIRVSVGIAAYDPEIDKTVKDVIVHADHLMYANKRERKAALKKAKNGK